MLLLDFQKHNFINGFIHFAKNSCHTPCQVPKASGDVAVPASKVCPPTMLLLQMLGNNYILFLAISQWHINSAAGFVNVFKVSQMKWGNSDTQIHSMFTDKPS